MATLLRFLHEHPISNCRQYAFTGPSGTVNRAHGRQGDDSLKMRAKGGWPTCQGAGQHVMLKRGSRQENLSKTIVL